MTSGAARFALRNAPCRFTVHHAVTPNNALSQARAADNRIASVEPVPDEMLAGMKYRMIGPHRGGRATAVTGVPGDHRTFYMGATGGGVWKTSDAGEVWE